MNFNLKKYITDIAFVLIVASAIAFVGWLTHKAINKCEAQAVNYQQVRECINL